MAKLSERVRPDVEAAPWVIAEIEQLESALWKIEVKAQAGLCYFTLISVREYLKDVRDCVADALKTARPDRD